jgi:hypothetical protein
MTLDEMMERASAEIDEAIAMARQEEMRSLLAGCPDEDERDEWLAWRDRTWSQWRKATVTNLRAKLKGMLQ